MKLHCVKCKKPVEVDVSLDQIYLWRMRETFVQDEFPHLTASEREMLVSGICPECWNKIFPPEDE